MSEPVITVITPVLNGADFITGCLENVAAQDCPQAVHLVVDGLSTDGTQERVKAFASGHPRVELISEKDSGQSDAMNNGIAAAKTPLVGFLNADDYYEPGTLKRVAALAADLPEPSFIYGNLQVWGDGGKDLGLQKPVPMTLKNLCRGKPYPLNPASYFYHKSLHEAAGPYDVDDHYTMDLDFLYRVTTHAKARYFDERWGHFRLIEGTKTLGELQSGESFQRQIALREKYVKQLPPADRLLVKSANALQPLVDKVKRKLRGE